MTDVPPARRRWGVRLLGVLVVLLVLGGGLVVAAPVADEAARTAAQERVATELRRETGARGVVGVQVGGGWFLPQVLRGTYPQVTVSAQGVPADGLDLQRVDVVLRDVRLPLRDVLRRDVGGIRAARATAEVQLGYPALNAYLADQGRPLSVAPVAGGGALVVTGTTEVLGREVSLSGDVDLRVSGGEVQAVPRELRTGTSVLDRLSRRVLSGLSDELAFTVPLQELPFGLGVTGVQAGPSALLVSTEGTDVVLAP